MSLSRAARDCAYRILPRRAHNFLGHLARSARLLVAPPRITFTDPPAAPPASAYAFPVAKPNLLEELGEKYQPTKRLHHYLPWYWMHFRDIRLEVRKVIEIGVQSDRSIRMWEEFFPNATIYGVDIDPQCQRFEGGRRKVFIGDQGDPEFCRRVIAEIGGAIDIVIDDGSHFVEHQLASFNAFFPAMTDHGIYVVEDTGGCVRDPELATVNALKRLVDSIMYWPPDMDPGVGEWMHLTEFPAQAKWIDRNIAGIAFYRWIVFVLRGRNPQDNPFLKPR